MHKINNYQENTEEKENMMNLTDDSTYLFGLHGMHEYRRENYYFRVLKVQRLVTWISFEQESNTETAKIFSKKMMVNINQAE